VVSSAACLDVVAAEGRAVVGGRQVLHQTLTFGFAEAPGFSRGEERIRSVRGPIFRVLLIGTILYTHAFFC
jgi:hypothetical protein